jgi:hypothetical protein
MVQLGNTLRSRAARAAAVLSRIAEDRTMPARARVSAAHVLLDHVARFEESFGGKFHPAPPSLVESLGDLL